MCALGYFTFKISISSCVVGKDIAPLGQQTNKQTTHKMKTTITNIFLLGATILLTGQLFGQSIQSQEKLSYGQSAVSSFTDVLNPNFNATFKPVIYPNPTFIGKVKITWPDWAGVTKVQVIQLESEWVKEIEIAENQVEISVHDLQEGVYIVRFFKKNHLLGIRKLQVIN